MAIVMLNYFDPRELGLQSGATFSPRDVSSLYDVGYSALSVANDCLSKVGQRNRTGGTSETVGFRSDMGWASQGKSSMIVIDNDVVKTGQITATRYDQLHWCISLGYRLGNRQKSSAWYIWKRDCSTLQFDDRG